MNKEEFISSGLLELYAMGISSPEESKIVEDHLTQFPELKSELNDIELSLEKYAQSNSLRPSPSVKEQLFTQLFPRSAKNENTSAPIIPLNKKTPVPLFYKSVAAAAFILLIGSIIVNYNYYNKYHDADRQLQLARETISKQGRSNESLKEDLNVVTNKYSQPVVLNGTPKAPDAVAKIFWMKNTGEVYIDPTNLPKAPEGKQYQLWAIVDGKPVDGGMIETAKGIYYIQKMKTFGKAEAFAITLENTGGSPTPTMDEMVVIAKM